MAVIKMDEYEEYPVLPDNSIIITTVTDLTVKDVNGQNGTWQKLELTFRVDGIQATGDGSPVEGYESLVGGKIWGSVPFRFTDSPENKLKQWVEAIFGMELAVGFELDTDLLTNKKVRAITSSYAKKSIDPRTGQPFRQHQVDALLPFGSTPQPAMSGAPAAALDAWSNPPATPVLEDPGF